MKEDKNIDRLFQEKLKDFEFAPSPLVWENIEQKLNKKKKRRILPFWIWSGTVASLAVLIFLFTFKTKKENNHDKQTDFVTTEKENLQIEERINTFKVTSVETENTKNNKNLNLENNKPYFIKKTREPFKTKKDVNTSKSIVALKTERTLSKKENDTKNIRIEKEKVSETKIAMEKKFSNKKNNTEHKKTLVNEEKTAITESYIANKVEEKKRKNLKQQFDDKEFTKNKKVNNKWAIQPTFGILSSKSYGKGSSIDSKFNNNKIAGKNTQSYGLKVSYQINKKWTLQSGLHLQELEFSTQNIVVSSGVLSVSSSSNIIKNNDDELFYSTPDETSNTSPIDKNNGIYIDNEISTNNGILNQKYGYLELPIEIKYSFLQKNKFDFSTVTGFSSLILAKNQIALENRGNSTVFGEASNLNPVNFSVNLGLDLNYSLNNKLNFNVSPMFKTPLNTFSKNSNGFKPYYIGIYTGIRYSF